MKTSSIPDTKKPAPRAPMKIQKLAARTGVSKSTIHYYIEKGLLPRPKKANRTIAYYDESYIDRIRLIRGFQERAFLPLSRIKQLLKTVPDNGMLENILVISAQYTGWVTDAAPAGPMYEAEAIRSFGISRRTLARLERLGVISPEVNRGRRVYQPEDVEILKVLVRMSERGFTPKQGWPTEALSIYVNAAQQLAEKEVAQLFNRMREGLDPKDAQSLFNETGEDVLLNLFLWMRRKAMRKEFGKRVRKLKKRT
ncbi:MAG: MerR family transcriptional regulator [Candidatus Abyssobacteria bacterium SURF_17]|jgi:DNA-binding transcriptional MerR regulator|uniref:MerR family transcriptional regulator n=1 Tax=Candidatus Abyssobacteria bacterium SURF_17 TaxID=2093361 RepID=A0A419ENV3_9BACT|nr:MAG: MerR family transcriptional regulator [Candidatus Abyssubacteria bacterium SURF_17]